MYKSASPVQKVLFFVHQTVAIWHTLVAPFLHTVQGDVWQAKQGSTIKAAHLAFQTPSRIGPALLAEKCLA